MEPLRITAVMQSGQLATYEGHFSLDGLMSWVWFQENRPELLAYGAADKDWPDAELPFERRVPSHDAKAWYWAVSFGHFKATSEYLYHWHRRFAADQERYMDLSSARTGRINTKAGYMKSYRHPVPVLLIPEITWYAVGDAQEITRMVNQISWIGKNRSQGFGWINQWRVESWSEDWSEHVGNHRMRDIPVPEDEADGYSSIRPPYWHRRNKYPVEVWDGPIQSRNLQITG